MPNCALPTPGPVDLSVWNFQSKSTVGALITTIPACLISGGLLYSYAVHGTSKRQLKYLAIPILLPAIYGVISLFSIAFYAAAGYLEPLPRIFEGLAIFSFFKYLHVCCQAVQGDSKQGRLARLFVFISVYQLPLTLLILTVANEVLAAKVCLLTHAFRLGRLVINLCALIVIVLAVLGVLVYLRHARRVLKPMHPVKKFCVLKFMIVIVTLEYLIIEAAVTKDHVAKKTHTSFYDLYYGLPAIIVACEMPIFAGLMYWAFPVSDTAHLDPGDIAYGPAGPGQQKPMAPFTMDDSP